MQFDSVKQFATELAGYANIVTFIATEHLDIHDDDDVMDAMVEVTKDHGHLTDEQLQQGLSEFREWQKIVRA